jgi:glycosyltransferase involved in cell wall biosynthesis
VVSSDSSNVKTDTAILGVIMPVFNEARTLDVILERALGQRCVAEVVAVDDGSTDGSWDLLSRWPGRDPRVRTFRHDRNQGKGAAIHTALAQVQSPLVLIQDADLEYDPADYAALLEPILAGHA